MKKMLMTLLALALMVSALAAPAMATGEDLVGGDLLVGVVGTPYAVNGWTSNDLNANLIADMLYPSLLKFDENANKQCYILESYESNEDMTVWTAKIHDGIYWHDGEKAQMMEFQKLFVEEIPSVNLLVREQGYGFSTEKWEGWDAQPGLYGVADASNITKVHLKK